MSSDSGEGRPTTGSEAVGSEAIGSAEPHATQPSEQDASAAEQPAISVYAGAPADGGGGADGSPTADVGELQAELEQARQERDVAVQQLETKKHPKRWRAFSRSVIVGILVVLFAIFLPIAATIGWVQNSILSTDGWVRTVAPLASNPAVTSTVSVQLTDQLFTSLDVQSRVANVLPPRADFLAGPITTGAKGYVQQAIASILSSPKFQTLWVEANRFAHSQIVAILEGHSTTITTSNGQVVLDLVPLLNTALAQLSGVVSGIVGRPVTLPTLTGNEVPADACARIGSALGVSLPPTCAQIPLFPADKLQSAQSLVRRLHNLVVALFVITPLIPIAAVVTSRRRRRTLLQLTVAGILGLVVFRRVLYWLQSALVNNGNPANKDFRHAVLAQVLHGFFDLTLWLVLGLLVFGLVVAVTGPYRWAVAVRAAGAKGYRGAADFVDAVAGRTAGSGATVWIRAHVDLLRFGAVLLAALLLLILSVSWVGFLVIAVVLAVVEFVLFRLKQQVPRAAEDGAAPPTDAVGGGSPGSAATA